jgi:uncharacterized phage protein (TIGR01671 family)
MKREIIFRGKRIDNGEWVEGYLSYSEQCDRYYIGVSELMHPVNPETAGQYTGLKDKKGVKIFEGDLLRVCKNKNGLLKVEFVNEYVGGWVLTHKSTDQHLSLGARKTNDIEIIGNIHDNKELLED